MPTISEFMQALMTRSVEASLLVMLILFAKFAFGKWLSPRAYSALWLLLVAKLLLPAGPDSALSLTNYIPGLSSDQSVNRAGRVYTGWMPAPLPTVDSGGDTASPESQSAPTPPLALRLLFWTWLAGAATVLAMLVMNTLRFRRLLRLATPIVEAEVRALFEASRREAGVRRSVQLLESSDISTPLLTGILNPRIVLPKSLVRDGADSATLRFVFLHELVHLRRGDLIVSWLVAFLQVVHWFNPILWLAFSRLRTDREISCDYQVLKLTGDDQSANYGNTLLNLAAQSNNWRPGASVLGVITNKTHMERRIQMIARKTKNGIRSSIVAVIVAGLLAAVSLTSAQTPAVAEPISNETAESVDKPATGPQAWPMINSDASTSAPIWKKPYLLTVDEEKGELEHIFGVDRTLERIGAKNGVNFKAAELSFKADSSEFNIPKQTLTANGPGLEVTLVNGITLTGDTFEYDVITDRIEMTGSVTFAQKNAKGLVTTMDAENIVFENATSSKPTIRMTGSSSSIQTR